MCSAASGQTMRETFRWTFSTVSSCDPLEPPSARLVEPTDGSNDRPLDQVISIEFTTRDQTDGTDSPANFALESFQDSGNFAVLLNATEANGDLVGGQPIDGVITFDVDTGQLTFTPSELLPHSARVFVRLTDSLRDVCGNPLQTPPLGVKLFSFDTVADVTPPLAPMVDPVPSRTRETVIIVTGKVIGATEVTITGGASPATGPVDAMGNFAIPVMLRADQANTLSVVATNQVGNASAPVTMDINGEPLVVVQDGTPPELLAIAPFDGETGVPLIRSSASVSTSRLTSPQSTTRPSVCSWVAREFLAQSLSITIRPLRSRRIPCSSSRPRTPSGCRQVVSAMRSATGLRPTS